MKKGYKQCPYCGEEIREIAKKCRYCHEFLEENGEMDEGKKKYKCRGCGQLVKEGDKECLKCGSNLNWGDIKRKKKYRCNNCGQLVKFGDKECSECGTNLDWTHIYKKDDSILRNREQLSIGEQKYITKNLMGMRIFTLFFPPIGLIRSKRWGDFAGLIAIYFVCLGICVFGGPVGFVELINLILSRIIALASFSKEAYKHDKPYFQRYLDEYAELHKKP